ncbi:hypothetical protein AOL_s00079g226 [Orbilia oligospora ATCC 24927]|uniref:lipoyl(octanoyl) transferase n=2 Tax=Orbilia oligospora TaxID=2813651 RepID=G1XCQ6_ARTOA|nr:hypothetical protein AOL_s00079g226 [Orbilia oligospora ATCC 24927]EGX49005.1 hypothetical protein AOL_s00079g226 [Orbilia oligospora ATCC 24927]KAF3284824.1 hypothetical protein TWF970_011103 [Orbilia oligospora]
MPTPIHNLPALRVLKLPLSDYSHVSKLQSILFNLHLLYKSSQSTPNPIPQPPPYLITSSFHPIYTFGRREAARTPPEPVLNLLSENKAAIAYTPRGGQVTFHGPGQVVAYPILDLKRHGLSPKCYVRVLEKAVIRVLRKWGIKGFTTKEAGVWVKNDRKVASIGVNLRRWVSSHGLALNVDTDLEWFKKIVACGLDGVEMWSMKKEWEDQLEHKSNEGGRIPGSLTELINRVDSKVFKRRITEEVVHEIADGIGCRLATPITVEEVEELGRKYELSGEDGIEWLKYWDSSGLYYRVKGDNMEMEGEERVPEEKRETDLDDVKNNNDTDPDEGAPLFFKSKRIYRGWDLP